MKQTSVAVGNRRLLKLAAFLRTVPRQRFDYRYFTDGDWKGSQDLSCGTKACALGWAATMPAFRRLGLHLDRSGIPFMKDLGPWRAIDELFGEDAEFLFWPAGGEDRATPKQVAHKIERFVKQRSA